jgi:hypothetical protein
MTSFGCSYRRSLPQHHDFFLASQHPSASSDLKSLAKINSMPMGMWHYEIQKCLDLLRHRLPDSLEHMLTFIKRGVFRGGIATSTFEETWIEYLGDFGNISKGYY